MTGIVITIIFAVVGIGIIVFDVLKRKRCSVTVRAECIAVDSRRSGNSGGGRQTTYNPTWEIEYDGRRIELKANSYSSRHVAVGHHRNLRINPENPEEFLDPSGGLLLIGIGFVVIGILGTVVQLTGGGMK
ncbi:MAG: hypothetical protein K5770_12835 [Lachnospiraceae bacterium]|nr:hypothetical protein [Lachnospiraceae bacterium]